MKLRIVVPRIFFATLLVAAATGCSEPEEIAESLGTFPDGPVFTRVGQVFEYQNERSFSSTGAGVPDSLQRGRTTVTVDSLTPFGSWPLAYRVGRIETWVNSDETRVDTTRSVSWRIFDFEGDTVATLIEVGEGPVGSVEELAEPRALLRFPISAGDRLLSTWGSFGTQTNRWSRGRDDIVVEFEIVGEEVISGDYEAYRVDEEYLTLGTSQVDSREWWGPFGVIRESVTSVSDSDSIVTDRSLELYTSGE